LALYVFLWSRKQPQLAGRPSRPGEFRTAALRVIGPLGAPVLLLGGILSGLFTPTEAAAVGVAYVVVLGFCYRRLTLGSLWGIAVETATTAAAIALILAASGLLGWVLARERVPQDIASFMLGFTDNPAVFLFLVSAVLLLIGSVLEPIAALVITVPVLLPIASQFGVNPVHFGVIVIINLMLGLLTPPIGGVLFVLGSATRNPMHEVFRGTAPFLLPLLAVLVLLILAPQLVLFLPDQRSLYHPQPIPPEPHERPQDAHRAPASGTHLRNRPRPHRLRCGLGRGGRTDPDLCQQLHRRPPAHPLRDRPRRRPRGGGRRRRGRRHLPQQPTG